MITYEQAKEKALKVDKDINMAWEYRGAYMFVDSKKVKEYDAEIVVLKSNGNVTNMGEYVIHMKDDEKPKKLKF